MPREKKNATSKGKVKSSRVKKHKNGSSGRKTTKASRCDCPKPSRSKQEEKIVCHVCNKKHNISDCVQYNDHLYFYWCACSVSAKVFRKTSPLKSP